MLFKNIQNLFPLLLLLLSISTSSIALPPDTAFHTQGSISISAGTSIPASALGSKSYPVLPINNSSLIRSGYAKQGYFIQLAIGYLVTKAFGIRAAYSGSFNSLDTSSFDNINQSGPIKPANYYTGQLLLGPFFHIALGNRISIEPSVMAGLITSHYPIISSSNSPQQLALSRSTTAGYNGSILLSYKLSNICNMGIYADYASSTAQYNGYDYTDTSGNFFIHKETKALELGLWQTGVSISYNF
jgi:hypothetical protein